MHAVNFSPRFRFAGAIVLVMLFLDRRDTLPVDTLLGLLAHGGLALGLVVLACVPSVRVQPARAALRGHPRRVPHGPGHSRMRSKGRMEIL